MQYSIPGDDGIWRNRHPSGYDALAVEDKDSEAIQTYANVLVVKEGNEKDEGILALAKALQSEEVNAFIEENYEVAVIAMF